MTSLVLCPRARTGDLYQDNAMPQLSVKDASQFSVARQTGSVHTLALSPSVGAGNLYQDNVPSQLSVRYANQFCVAWQIPDQMKPAASHAL